jgi:hypothetical protein
MSHRISAVGGVCEESSQSPTETLLHADRITVIVRGMMPLRGSSVATTWCNRLEKLSAEHDPDRIAQIKHGRQKLERSTIGSPGSKLSELLSFEVLMVLLPECATLLKNEQEFKGAMANNGQGGIVDYTLALPTSGRRLGCSVTRAFGYCNRRFSPRAAHDLLRRKLARLKSAQQHAGREDTFETCVLHVWVRSTTDAGTVAAAAHALRESEPEGSEDVTILISVASDGLAGIF